MMPKTGTAKNTETASAAVVESDDVGAWYRGTTSRIFAVRIKMPSVPRKGRKGRASAPVTCFIWPAAKDTRASNRPCQRGIFSLAVIPRVTSAETMVKSAITAHV